MLFTSFFLRSSWNFSAFSLSVSISVCLELRLCLSFLVKWNCTIKQCIHKLSIWNWCSLQTKMINAIRCAMCSTLCTMCYRQFECVCNQWLLRKHCAHIKRKRKKNINERRMKYNKWTKIKLKNPTTTTTISNY